MRSEIEKTLIKQISVLDRKLIETSFSISNNFVSSKQGEVAWSNYKNISFALRKVSYTDLYDQCIKENAYNFKLIDGALIQLMYLVDKNAISKHRLSYMPNPRIEQFLESPEDYETLYFGEELFSDMITKKALPFPLRIDFDNNNERFIEHYHSYAHLTLGNFSNCRIPVASPVSPFKFISFILQSFYLERFTKYFKLSEFACDLKINSTISKAEMSFLHLSH